MNEEGEVERVKLRYGDENFEDENKRVNVMRTVVERVFVLL